MMRHNTHKNNINTHQEMNFFNNVLDCQSLQKHHSVRLLHDLIFSETARGREGVLSRYFRFDKSSVCSVAKTVFRTTVAISLHNSGRLKLRPNRIVNVPALKVYVGCAETVNDTAACGEGVVSLCGCVSVSLCHCVGVSVCHCVTVWVCQSSPTD